MTARQTEHAHQSFVQLVTMRAAGHADPAQTSTFLEAHAQSAQATALAPMPHATRDISRVEVPVKRALLLLIQEEFVPIAPLMECAQRAHAMRDGTAPGMEPADHAHRSTSLEESALSALQTETAHRWIATRATTEVRTPAGLAVLFRWTEGLALTATWTAHAESSCVMRATTQADKAAGTAPASQCTGVLA